MAEEANPQTQIKKVKYSAHAAKPKVTARSTARSSGRKTRAPQKLNL